MAPSTPERKGTLEATQLPNGVLETDVSSMPDDADAALTVVTPVPEPLPSSPPPSDNATPISISTEALDEASSGADAKTPTSEEEAAAAEELITLDIQGARSRIWVMIVAIDKYPRAPLRGCVADGRAIEDFVKNKLYVPESQIVFLQDEAASRKAILSTFNQHFTENEEIAKGDGIVFYYAGHGSHEHAPNDWGLDGELVECICPQDLDWKTVHGIPSTTLNALFRELADRKGDNITAVFDCCHSGRITRILEGGQEKRSRYMLPPSHLEPSLPPSLDGSVHKWWPNHYGRPRAAKTVLPPGFCYDTMRSHVLLSACRADEEAMEHPVGKDKVIRGWFTSTFLELVEEHEGSTPGLTYSYLCDTLLSSKASSSQHPQCMGKHKNRLLWNTIVKISDGFRVTVSDGCISVHAGRVHGIALRTTFTVQGRDMDRRLGVLTVVDLQDLRCVCKCEGTPFDVTTGSRAVVQDWNNEDLSVDIYIDRGVMGRHATLSQSSIPTSLADYARIIDTREKADLAIVPQPSSSASIVGWHDPLLGKFAPEIIANLVEYHLHDLISAALHFNFHLYRRHPNPYNPLSAVRLEMYKMELKCEGQYRFVEADQTNYLSRNIEVPACKGFGHTVIQEAIVTDCMSLYGLKIVNDTSFDLFAYLFYFEPSDYSIQIWYGPESPTSARPLEGHSSLKVNYGPRETGKNLIKLVLPPGQITDSGFVRMFVSTCYVDMKHIVTQGYKSGRKAVLRGPENQGELWGSSTYVLTCQRAEEGSMEFDPTGLVDD